MCPVDYFGVFYKINPWMHPEKGVNREKAIQEWKNLVKIYEEHELPISYIDPINGLPDMVFAANGLFSLNKKAIVARFRYKERQGETEYYTNWLQQNSHQVIDPGKTIYEGEGDTFLVGSRIYQGWGFRSDKEIIDVFTKTYPDKKVVALHLINDKFYHLDTCFFPVNESRVYYYKAAFDEETQNVITNEFPDAIAVTDEEAMSFCLNSMIIGNTIITNSLAVTFAERVKKDGYDVVMTDMSEFLKSGGSVKCLTNEMWEEEK